MSESLLLPNTSIIGQTGVDEAITIIQRELSPLVWLENSLGRIKPESKGAGLLPEPWLYKQNGEYYPAYPNDTLTSFSALYAHDDEQIEGHGFMAKRTVSVIVWVNLQTIGIEPPTVEGLKQDVIRKLRGLYAVMSIGKVYDQTATGANGVYPNFDVSGLEPKYLSYPFGGFRIETVVQYTNLCY